MSLIYGYPTGNYQPRDVLDVWEEQNMGISRTKIVGGPHNSKDYSILASILGSHLRKPLHTSNIRGLY